MTNGINVFFDKSKHCIYTLIANNLSLIFNYFFHINEKGGARRNANQVEMELLRLLSNRSSSDDAELIHFSGK